MDHQKQPGWAAVLPALVVPLLGSLVYFVWMPEGAVGQAAYTLTKIFLVVYPLLFVARTGWGGLWRRRTVGGRLVRWRTILWTGLASGALISLAGAGLMLTPLGDIIRDGASGVRERAEGLGFLEHYLLFAVFLSLLHSALEEYYWRWFVYGSLRRLVPGWGAHALAGVGFAAHHLVVTLQFFPPAMAVFLSFCVAIGGVIWTVMSARQGTVVGAWLSHLCVDVLLMWIGHALLGLG